MLIHFLLKKVFIFQRCSEGTIENQENISGDCLIVIKMNRLWANKCMIKSQAIVGVGEAKIPRESTKVFADGKIVGIRFGYLTSIASIASISRDAGF